MALVGDAYVVVRAITTSVERDIQKSFKGVDAVGEKAGVDILDVKQFFLHQANEKMDAGFIKALFKLYGIREVPSNIMPMSIHELGNSSVATIPTLYDMVKRGKYKDHELQKGDVIVFASVGAGMNINAICYRV